SESEYETSEYYDNTTNYGLFVNDNDDQEIFHECENIPENLIESQINHNESVVDHNDYEGIDKFIRKFNKKIVKCQNRVEKANQQSKDFENQNKDLQDKYDVLKNQTTTFEMNNNELNEQLKELIEKNNDLLAQTKLLKEQLQVKHVVIDTHLEYVNDAMGFKKKPIVVTSDPLALIAEKTKVSKSKEKVVSSDSKGSSSDEFSELKKITALLAKAFNQRKFYSKPTNNNLRTSSSSQSANKKQEFVKTGDKKEDKKADEKKRDMSKVKCYNCKKEGHFEKDCKKANVKDYEYYKTKMLLAKMNKFFWLKTKLGWSPVVILIRKSMQTWSSWLKLRKFFQIQRLAHRLLMKRFL
nr:hypothetical protein [Tanacetum cinerariifolium]